jgi:DNA polymerase III alpha subunit
LLLTNIGFNKYSYDLTCKYNLLANGIFKPGQQGPIVYRPIDPTDPFPRYAPLGNWAKEQTLINNIIRLGYGVYTLNPEYEITLNANSINAIRGYNASNACRAGQKINCGYLNYDFTEKKDKNGKQFAYINIYSSFGLVEGIVWHSQLKEYEDIIKKGTQLAILCKKDNEEKVIVEKMKPYDVWLKQTEERGIKLN